MTEPTETELVVGVDGGVKCIYDESLDLRALGKLQITRASHVEPDSDGNWWADMGPSGGPVLGPFRSRSEALAAERGWLVGGGGARGSDNDGRKRTTATTDPLGKQITRRPSLPIPRLTRRRGRRALRRTVLRKA
jgi:hypothetical protein